jgi:biopolymer transport protein ExbD
MAGVDVGGAKGNKRATNSDINMVPFIDLLMCTIAFLLITAVWVTNSRMPLDAQVPGPPGCGEECARAPQRMLHVTVGENDFSLVWKLGGTVISETHVPRNAVEVGDTVKVSRYPELAKAIEKEWGQLHEHSDPNDRKQDQLVLHSDDRAPFRDLVAVMDAVRETRRDLRGPDGATQRIAAFNPTFAVR